MPQPVYSVDVRTRSKRSKAKKSRSVPRRQRDALIPRLYRWRWAIAIAALATLVVADRSGCFLVRPADDYHHYHGVTARVLRVVEPTVLEVDVADPVHGRSATHVRLWGVRTEAASADAIGASESMWKLVESFVDGGPVTLRLEPHRHRDDAGRVLAHVHLADDRSLNEHLLREGYARADDRWPHGLLHRYAQLEQAAQGEGRGMWAAEPQH